MNNRYLLALALAGVAAAGVAYAQTTAPASPPAPPAMPMRADADHDRAVSRAEFLAEAGRRFDEMDSNKDGTLTREERRAWHQAHHRPGMPGGPDMPPPPPGAFPPPPPPPGSPGGYGPRGGGLGGGLAMLQRLDRDGDGKVSRAEFNAPFDLLDANRDGFIDATEQQAAPQRPGGFGGGNRFTRLDRDGDGKVSREEFGAPFDRLDLNHDGSIDQAEVEKIRGRLGGGRFGRGRFGGGQPPAPQDAGE